MLALSRKDFVSLANKAFIPRVFKPGVLVTGSYLDSPFGSLSVAMSYKPIQDTEHLDSSFHENATLDHANSEKHEPAEVKRRVFKSSRALHLAISVAAGTVMTLFGYEQGVL